MVGKEKNDYKRMSNHVYIGTIVASFLEIGLAALITVAFQIAVISSNIFTDFISNYLPTFICPLIVYKLILGKPKDRTEVKEVLSVKSFVLCLLVTTGIVQIIAQISNMTISAVGSFAGISSRDIVDDAVSNITLEKVLLAGVIGPFMEEIVFRKVLLNRIAHMGRTYTILISALAFSFFHLNIYQTFYTFALGLILGDIAFRTQSIKYTVCIHVYLNTLTLLITYFRGSFAGTCLNGFVWFCCFVAILDVFIKLRKHENPYIVDQSLRWCVTSLGFWVFLMIELLFSSCIAIYS
jgi:membrane protease YdiL (CAAX protease family)